MLGWFRFLKVGREKKTLQLPLVYHAFHNLSPVCVSVLSNIMKLCGNFYLGSSLNH